jgi:hypothetical protein
LCLFLARHFFIEPMKKQLRLVPLAVLFLALTFTSQEAAGLNETEPNGNFATANHIPQDSTMNGVCAAGDNDYFYSVPGDDGTIRVTYGYTGSSSGDDVYVYVYNKGGGLIGSQSHFNVGTTQQNDSLFVYCRQQDTVYFRLVGSGSVSYSFQYTTIPSGTSDAEPNDAFTSAQFINSTDTTNGRIGYTGTAADGNDYFETVLPIYGTFKLYIDYLNTSNSTGSDIYFYVYNKAGGLLSSKSKVNQPLGASQDSIFVYCREQDTLYIRISANGCFSYQFYYEVDAPATNDVEPNNNFTSAQPVTSTSATGGRIGYASTQTDQNDYFLAALPTFGTLNFYLQYDNTSNSTGADLYAYIYNKAGGLIGSSSLVNRPLGVGFDTISINCRELDTVYFRISSTACFSYSFTYDVYAPTTNDVEPNNSFADAKPFLPNDTLGGRIAYISTSTDQNDFFYSVLPEDGTIKYFIKYFNTSGSTGSDLYSYIYNKGGGLLASSSKTNQPLGLSTDSIAVHCRARDTVFFRLSATGCFSYKIYYEMDVPTPADSAGNDAFATAQAVSFTDTTYGRVGYTSTGTDQNDFYLTVLPDDGTLEYIVEYTNTSGSTGSDYYSYIYNKNGGLLNSSSKINQALGAHVDTILVPCRAADTVFFRTASSGCFSYKFYQNVLSSGTADSEPNNSIATADSIALNNTLAGRIGYTSTSSDPDDYFVFDLPEYSNITAYLNFNNTSNSTGSDFYVYLYNSGGGLVFSNFYTNNQLGVTADTLNMNCLPGGVYTLRIRSNGCFSYEMDFDVENQQPISRIVTSQLGHEVGFQAITELADSFLWNFDDGTTSTFQYPLKEFAIGGYNVVLEASNSTCSLTTYDTAFIEVKGVELYEPKKAGAGSNAALHIYGGGLDTNTKVTLRMGGIEYTPTEQYGNNKNNLLTAIFDFHFAEEGVYDLIIEIPGEPAVTFTNGFTIEDFVYPSTTADVVGPTRIRNNRDTRFFINITNTGNVNANGAIFAFAWPKNIEVTFEHDQIVPPDTGLLTITTEDTTVSMDWSEQAYIYDSVQTSTAIDSFDGQPYDGYVRFLMIPHIPANTTFSLPFLAKASTSASNTFIVHTLENNLFGSCDNPNYLDMIENFGVQSLDLVDMAADNTNNGLIKAFSKTAKIGRKHIAVSGQLAGAEFWAWWDGYEVPAETYQDIWQNLDAANDYAMRTTVEEVGSFALDKGVGKMGELYTDQIHSYNKVLTSPINKNMSPELRQQWVNNLSELLDNADRLDETYEMFKEVKNLKTLNDKINDLQKMVNDCPELQKQLDDLKKKITKQIKPKDQKKRKTQSVTSFDPNAIYGPTGVGANRWITNGILVNYLITFENFDTAQADAQVVIVYDTINPGIFDLKTFQFGNVNFGNFSRRVPPNRTEFVLDVDMNPAKNLTVRIFGKLDTVSGIVSWRFVTIDPNTGELPIFDGFLPPNVTSPEGEGSVMYSVAIRSDVSNQTRIPKRATIFFDENDPIETNTWENSIDIAPPTSSLTATVQDTVIFITFNSGDNESGILSNYLYLKDFEGTWIPFISSPTDTLTVYGEPGRTYEFYGTAEDSIGLEELKTPFAEATVTISGLASSFNPAFQLYPNPRGSGPVYVRSNGNFPNTEVTVYDILGRAVYQSTNDYSTGSDTQIRLPKLPAGTYQFFFETANGKTTVARLVLFNARQ